MSLESLFTGILMIWLIWILIFIVAIFFWFVMLIDAITRKFSNPTDKIVWILILLFLVLIGAFIYYFMVYRKKEVKKTRSKKKKEGVPYVLLIIAGFIILISIVKCGSNIQSPAGIPTVQKVYLNKSYDELKEIFGSGSTYTDLQKDDLWNNQYRGKYVVWTGKVKEVDSTINQLRLDVIFKEGLLFDEYSIVYLNRDQYDKLLALNKGDMVTFSGKLDMYGTTLGLTFYLQDGEIHHQYT